MYGDNNDVIRLVDKSFSYGTDRRLSATMVSKYITDSRTWVQGVMPSDGNAGTHSFNFSVSGIFASDGLTS